MVPNPTPSARRDPGEMAAARRRWRTRGGPLRTIGGTPFDRSDFFCGYALKPL